MMRSSLVAIAAARVFFQAPSPASVPVGTPAVSYEPYAAPYAPVAYGFDQASAFPSVAVAAPPMVSTSTSSKSAALPLLAGAAVGATVAVLFGGGKKAAAKPKPGAKAAPAAKKPVARAAPKKTVARAPVKRSSGKSPQGKGGIFPWVTNEPGTYAKPLMLSSIDFLGDDGDKLVGWGFMPNSVKALYNPKGRKGLFGGCVTPAKK